MTPPLRRQDERDDAAFYAVPRLVTHIDDAAIDAVTDLYRRVIPAGGDVLDLMSSWVSHLPPEVGYGRVVGLGMNAAELSRNPRLTGRVVRDLNADPTLPFADGEFDAAACCASIDYLVRPAAVCREVRRVLRPGGVFAVTFSNRLFPTKATLAWLSETEPGRVALAAGYLRDGGFASVDADARSLTPPGGDPLWAIVGRR